MKKRWRIAFAVVAIVVGIGIAIGASRPSLLPYAVVVVLYGIPTAMDRVECVKIRHLFLQRHEIPKNSKSRPGHSPIFCRSGARGLVFKTPPKFYVYGALGESVQDRYLNTLQSILQATGVEKLDVEFYERENWTEWKSAKGSGGSRGPERLLRSETLSR